MRRPSQGDVTAVARLHIIRANYRLKQKQTRMCDVTRESLTRDASICQKENTTSLPVSTQVNFKKYPINIKKCGSNCVE